MSVVKINASTVPEGKGLSGFASWFRRLRVHLLVT